MLKFNPDHHWVSTPVLYLSCLIKHTLMAQPIDSFL